MTSKQQRPPSARPSALSKHLADDSDSARLSALVTDYQHIRKDSVNNGFLCDFSFGNPNDAPSAAFVDVLRDAITPKTAQYYSYRTNSALHCGCLAKSGAKRYAFKNLESTDVFLTTGNFAGLALALQLLTEPDDNVVYMDPGWFFYRHLILNSRAVPRRVHMPLSFSAYDDISDMRAFLDAIDDKTKVVIFNQPHNPTGKVYSRAWLQEFSEKLMELSITRGYPVYVLADEAYSDYVFDGIKHETIAGIYPYTVLAYTYNKMTLAPSQRVGYLILSPLMPGRESLREPLFSLQMTLTWCFPNAAMIESIPKLELMRDEFDPSFISKRRDRMRSLLEGIGFEVLLDPKGSFYMLVKTPMRDDVEFCKELARKKILVIPGSLFNTPHCFRICLTATEEMIERSVSGFQECFDNAARGKAQS